MKVDWSVEDGSRGNFTKSMEDLSQLFFGASGRSRYVTCTEQTGASASALDTAIFLLTPPWERVFTASFSAVPGRLSPILPTHWLN